MPGQAAPEYTPGPGSHNPMSPPAAKGVVFGRSSFERFPTPKFSPGPGEYHHEKKSVAKSADWSKSAITRELAFHPNDHRINGGVRC